jgi:nitroreductase
VPNELIRKILEAGVCAPSGGNMQRWCFLVIRDLKVKETVGALYKRARDEQVAPRYRAGGPAPDRIPPAPPETLAAGRSASQSPTIQQPCIVLARTSSTAPINQEFCTAVDPLGTFAPDFCAA